MNDFDFSTIAGLNTFWDGTKKVTGGGAPGGGVFNTRDNPDLKRSSNLDYLYQGLIGRNADPAGTKYWTDKLKSGENTWADVANTIKAGNEYKGQQTWLADNPNASADDLKILPNAYVSPFNQYSGSAWAGWQPGDRITTEMARSAATTESNPDGSQVYGADGKYISKSPYSDQTNKTVNDVVASLLAGGTIGGGTGPSGPGVGAKYDDSALKALIASLSGELGTLRGAFDTYRTDMDKMWANAEKWGWGSGVNPQQSTVQGVKTQNELPSWQPKTGGSAGFFGRGNRFGLTTSSLNI